MGVLRVCCNKGQIDNIGPALRPSQTLDTKDLKATPASLTYQYLEQGAAWRVKAARQGARQGEQDAMTELGLLRLKGDKGPPLVMPRSHAMTNLATQPESLSHDCVPLRVRVLFQLELFAPLL